jgi:hypothetical protein
MPTESSPRCKACASDKQKTFSAEVALHFCGVEGLNRPIVWVFPKVNVCLECGVAEFIIPERERQVLVTGRPVEGALVSLTQQSRAG